MANNPYVNKVVKGTDTLIDLTSDTVTANSLMQGYTAHDASGAPIVGVATGGVDGDNLAYGGVFVGSAIVGSAVLIS